MRKTNNVTIEVVSFVIKSVTTSIKLEADVKKLIYFISKAVTTIDAIASLKIPSINGLQRCLVYHFMLILPK